jgi:hypothetical protein
MVTLPPMVDDSSNANAWVSAWTNSGVGRIALAYASRACDTGLTLGRIRCIRLERTVRVARTLQSGRYPQHLQRVDDLV